MTAPAGVPASGLGPGADGPGWPTLSADRTGRRDPRNHPAKGDDTPHLLTKDLGIGSNRAGPDGGHASEPAALDRAMTEKV